MNKLTETANKACKINLFRIHPVYVMRNQPVSQIVNRPANPKMGPSESTDGFIRIFDRLSEWKTWFDPSKKDASGVLLHNNLIVSVQNYRAASYSPWLHKKLVGNK